MRKYLLPLLGAAFLLTAWASTKQAASETQSSEMTTTAAQTSSSQEEAKSGESYTVVDITGREISFDKVPEKVIALGHGTLKFYTYVAGPDKLRHRRGGKDRTYCYRTVNTLRLSKT